MAAASAARGPARQQSWGNPLATAVVILSFSLVGTGVAMLVGSICQTEQQAMPIAFCSGSTWRRSEARWPARGFPTDRPHDCARHTPRLGQRRLLQAAQARRGLITILPQVGVLLAFAAVATTIAVWRLRHTLTA